MPNNCSIPEAQEKLKEKSIRKNNFLRTAKSSWVEPIELI